MAHSSSVACGARRGRGYSSAKITARSRRTQCQRFLELPNGQKHGSLPVFAGSPPLILPLLSPLVPALSTIPIVPHRNVDKNAIQSGTLCIVRVKKPICACMTGVGLRGAQVKECETFLYDAQQFPFKDAARKVGQIFSDVSLQSQSRGGKVCKAEGGVDFLAKAVAIPHKTVQRSHQAELKWAQRGTASASHRASAGQIL